MSSTLVGLFLVSSAGFAQSAMAAGTQGDNGVETVVVTGRHVLTEKIPVKAAFSTSAITQDEIRNASPGATTTVQTLLNQVPSIQAVTSGPAGMRTNVTFRAFNDGQFGQTFDGVGLNDAFNAGTSNAASNRNNTLLMPQNIDGIEVHRGINNPAVNTYNSLGGTINYIPRQPGETMGADIGASYGSFNTFNYHATVNFGDWDGFRQLISFQHDYSDGWLQNTQDHNNNFYYAGEDNFNGGNSKIYAYLVYNTNQGYTPHSMPEALINQHGWDYQWPVSWGYSFNDDTNMLAIVGYKSKINDVLSFDAKIFGASNDYRRTSFANPDHLKSATQPYELPNKPTGYAWWLPGRGYPIPMNYDPEAMFGSVHAGVDYHFYGYQTNSGGAYATLTAKLPYNTITVGGNFSYSQLHSREYWYGTFNMPNRVGYNDAWDERDDRLLASGYVQDDIHFWNDRVHIVPGVKYLFAHTTDSDALGFYYSTPGSVAADQHYVSPTIGASVEVAKNLVFYGAFGQNVKFPDINAYYNSFQTDNNGNFVTVPVTVKPEYVNDYEAGIRYKRGGFTGAVNVYQENFQNIFITKTDAVSGLSSTLNGGAARYRGLELQLTDDFGHFLIGHWNGYLNYAHNEAEYTKTASISDTGTGADITKGQKVANVPHDLLTVGLTWKHDNWRVNAEGRYVGTRYIAYGFAGTPSNKTIPTYFTVDLGISKVVPLDLGYANAAKLSLHVDNLTDEHYYDRGTIYSDYSGNDYISALPAAGRAVYGSVSVFF